jgi:hypothetical protein
MYYSKILADLKKQDRNPVNKMYLSELSLKWKNFQQLTEDTSSANADLAEALSKFLTILHNRKFLYNKVRNNGFHEDSPIYSANYMNDLIATLMRRQPILTQTGISWDFQTLNYKLALSGRNPHEITESPLFRCQETPQVLSLALNLEYQYRITGKRNFTKAIFRLPYLLFFPMKHPAPEDIFLIEHYAQQVKSTCRVAQIFLISETLDNCRNCHFQDLPFKIFALHTESKNNPYQISAMMVDKLETAIKNVLYHSPESHLIFEKEKITAAPARTASKAKPHRNNYRKKK